MKLALRVAFPGTDLEAGRLLRRMPFSLRLSLLRSARKNLELHPDSHLLSPGAKRLALRFFRTRVAQRFAEENHPRRPL